MFKFRKVASILASAAMLSSSVAIAAATTYPAPFVQNGVADVAVVWGTTADATDQTAVTDIVASLSAALASQSTTTTTTVTGEAYPLFSSGNKLYFNDTLNHVRTGSITDSAMPTVLADGIFDSSGGNVDYQQTILLGSNPKLEFKSQPMTGDDPVIGWALSTTSTNYIYNTTVTFDSAVAFNHTNSEGNTIELFGNTYTVSSDTDTDTLILLKSAESIDLDSDNPTKTVTVGGQQYTVELRSASDTSATIKVTNSAGTSQSKEVTEDAGTSQIAGLSVAVSDADETNFKLSATVLVGADELKFEDAAAVSLEVDGDSEDIDGTLVDIIGGVGAMTKLVVSVYAPESDEDAILVDGEFLDPVWGTFKIDLPSLSAGTNSTDRETITIQNSGNDQMNVKFTDFNGNEKSFDWVFNATNRMYLNGDDDGHNITVQEEKNTHIDSWLVLPGAEGKGHFVRVTAITNRTTGYADDKVTVKDVFTDQSQDVNIDAEGSGTLSIGGDDYTVRYYGSATSDSTTRYIKVNFNQGSSAETGMVLYPTLATSKGALISFYEPATANLLNWNGRSGTLSTVYIPTGDEDTYDSTTLVANDTNGNFTVDGTVVSPGVTTSVNITSGQLTWNFAWSAVNTTEVKLVNPATGTRVSYPAIIIYEEKDHGQNNEALIVTLEPGNTADDGIGVDTVVRTWDDSSTNQNLDSRDDVSQAWDRWGTIIEVDASSNDQSSATISYPDEQVDALTYIAEASATIGGGSELGNPIFKDSESASFSSKNIIVVGGGCVNTVAAQLVEPTATTAICGPDWTTKTQSEAGSFIIQTFSYGTGKVATLVAGYNAADTTNAATYFRTQSVDTSVGKKYKGTTETSATLQTS